MVTVALADGAKTSEVKDWVSANFPRMTALENEEFSRSYSQFRIMKTTAWVVGGCAFLLGGLSVTNTMILSVFGRIRELAIARVCGFSRGQVAWMIFGESILISLMGIAAGWLLSSAGLRVLREVPQLQGYIEPTVGWVELARGRAEVVLRGALHAVGVVSKVDGVEVRSQDAILRPALLELPGERGFTNLALHGLRVRQVGVLDELLRDRAAALLDAPRAQVDDRRAREADRVDAEMAVEAAVLRRQQRLRQVRLQDRNTNHMFDNPYYRVLL